MGNPLGVLAARAKAIPGSVSWEDVHAALAAEAKRQGQWAGLPMPVKGMRMTVHPSYPFADTMAQVFNPESSMHVCRNSDVDETVTLRNSWASYRDGKQINICHDSRGYFWIYGGRVHSGTMLLDTLGAARSWDFGAELRAMETLKRHVTEWAYQCYVMTGSFLETSPRSQVTYLFRRLRPTVALSSRPDYKKGRGDVGIRILACLCLHPVGFFNGSWAGALVPTDDVLAHLLLMRGDEHRFWKDSNQHHPLAPESGL
jgi:hypothetical protein